MAGEDALSFIFGGNADAPTYEELKRRRAIAAALASHKRGYPKNIGEGLTYFGESLGEAIGDWRMREMERRAKAGETQRRGELPPETGPQTVRAPTTTDGRVPAPRPVTTTPAPKVVLSDPAVVLPDSDPALPAAITPIEGSIMSYGGTGPSTVKDILPVYNSAPQTTPPAPVQVPGATVGSATQVPVDEAVIAEDQTSLAPQRSSAAVLPEIPGAARDALRSAMLAQQRDKIAAVMASNPQHEANRPDGVTGPPLTTPAAFAPPAQAAAPPQAPQTAADIPFEGPIDDPIWAAREKAIAGIESGGSRNPYQLQGIATRGGRAQGKFQVMSDEVPDRTQAALGYRLTPEEFRDNPNAQHIQFRKQFGDAVAKYGEEGAARNWYGGDRGMYNLGASDAHGRLTVRGYGEDYMRRLNAAIGNPDSGSAPAVAAAAPREAGPPVQTLAVRPSDFMDEQPPVQQQAAAPATPEDIAQERLLREVALGGGRSSLLGRGATASRGDVADDSAPLGRLGTIGAGNPSLDASIEQRRNAITDALLPQTAPEVPQLNPTQTAGGPPTTSSSTGADPVRLAQAGPIDPSMFSPRPIGGGSIAPAPGGRPNETIRPAPAVMPSDEPIPAATPRLPREPQQPFQPEPISPRERALIQFHNDPRNSDEGRKAAAEDYKILEAQRLKRDERNWQAWTDERNERRAEPGKILDEQNKRLAAEKTQADLRVMQPLEIAVKRAEQQLKEAEARRIPDEMAKSRLAVDQARATLEETKQRIKKGAQKEHVTIGGNLLERQDDGSWKSVTPDVELGDIKLSEKEMTQLKYFERARQASHKHGNFAALTGLKDTATGYVPLGIGNYMSSKEYQIQRSEAEAWGEATLRDVSGAVLGPDEVKKQLSRYFPVPGDERNPELIEIKKQRRDVAERSLYDTLGPGRKIADKFMAEQKAQEASSKELEALQWIRDNPNDPNVARVKKKLGIP